MTSHHQVAPPLQSIIVVGIGNTLEFYDFFVFSYFAVQIGHTFFPTSHGLLLTLATFGVGFVTRPLGGIFIGRYGDKVGRKPAMLGAFNLMGLATGGLALIPSYAQIGIAAPILLILCRLLQGFAVGGETGPSTAFLCESAPPHRRGLYVGVQFATQGLAVVTAGVVGFMLSARVSPAQLDAWGWRCAFLIGALIVPVGLYLRRQVSEQSYDPAPSNRATGKQQLPMRLIVLSLMMLGAGTIATYTIGYMNTYMQDTLNFSANSAFGETLLEGVSLVSFSLIGGSLSDHYGRKRVMLAGLASLFLVSLPGYAAIGMSRSVLFVYALSTLFNALYGIFSVSAAVAVVESLPPSRRSGTFGILYAIVVAVLGGFTQFIIKWLIEITGNPLAPGWYLTVALIAGGAAMVMMPESAPTSSRLGPPVSPTK